MQSHNQDPNRMFKQRKLERDNDIENTDYCKTFGCGTKLSLPEKLASDYCTKCSHERMIKIKGEIYL